jgi:glycosyltransferase involved in cell wall biosynthesis
MIVAISDFSAGGSGYQRIMTNLCKRLAIDHDMHILALGLDYKGEEHRYPFAIVPAAPLSNIPGMIKQLEDYKAPIEAIFVGLDIPLQRALLQAMDHPGPIPYIGLFPLEAAPLCQPWAIEMLRMDARLIMSKFGAAEFKRAGVEAEFLPLGVDDLWRPPGPDERAMIRQGLGIDENTFMVLTVADNQERKNLSKAAEIISRLSIDIKDYLPNGFAGSKTAKRNVAWYLVSRLQSPVGWELQDMAMRYGIMDRVSMFNRGMPDDKLWALYAAADAFLLTSKAEGLAIPVMEAMACRLPVVATDCTAMAEHLSDNRGWLVPTEYEYCDPFGNESRYFVNAQAGADILAGIMDAKPVQLTPRLNAAQEYLADRTWDNAARIVADTLNEAIDQKETRVTDGEATAAEKSPFHLQPA